MSQNRIQAGVLGLVLAAVAAAAAGCDPLSPGMTEIDPPQLDVVPGETVVMLLPAAAAVCPPHDSSCDEPQGLAYFGRTHRFVTAEGCEDVLNDQTLYPEQDVRLSGPGAVPTLAKAITISHSTPIPTGTRLEDLVFLGPCHRSEASHDKYRGTVK